LWENWLFPKGHTKILAKQIAAELEAAPHCAVYNRELSRVWPRDGKLREAQIEKFAKTYGWHVQYYKDEFVAIFVKASMPRRQRTLKLKTKPADGLPKSALR